MTNQSDIIDQELLEKARKLSGKAQHDFLIQACGDDQDRKSRLESMLDKTALPDDLLADSLQTRPVAIAGSGTESMPGYHPKQIGPYTLLQPIGEGGMGTVWMAQQSRPVSRRVALKVIKGDFGSSEILARFEAERQALALMNHPHIASILDAGTTPDGQPYFAMELVEGKPLSQYCDENRLSINERLELFSDVCSGVQHAHQKGIIHRDLKPSNILVSIVDGKAVPKVIDFGLAKAMESNQRLTDQSLFTGIGQILGTLKYMSPEQASLDSVDIDTRTDIYALGVILYELLTGSTPLANSSIKGQAALRILEVIRNQEPIKPSRKLSSVNAEKRSSIINQRKSDEAKLNRILSGDLDWVVMKALEKDRTRRYESASGFAEDVKRFLNHEPVIARPPSFDYRIRKFARKNRGGVIVASLLGLSLLGGMIGTSIGFYRASRAIEAEKLAKLDAVSKQEEAELQRVRAEDRETEAIEAVRRFSDSVSDNAELKNNPTLKSLRLGLLRQPLAFFESLRERLQSNASSTPESLERLAKAAFELGKLTDQIGDKRNAIQAFENAVEVYEKLVQLQPDVIVHQTNVVVCQNNIGLLRGKTGQTADALVAFRDALEVCEQLGQSDPSNLEFQNHLATTHNNIGSLQHEIGKTDEGLASYEKAQAIQERILKLDPNNTDTQLALAVNQNNMGYLLSGIGRSTEAIKVYRRANQLFEMMINADASDAEVQNKYSLSLLNMANLLRVNGQADESIETMRRAQRRQEKLVASNPTTSEFRSNLAKVYQNLGVLHRDSGSPSEALADWEKAAEVQRALVLDNPTVTQFQGDLARNYGNIAMLLAETGRPEESEKKYQQSQEIFVSLMQANPEINQFQSAMAISHLNYANLLSAIGNSADAMIQYQSARKIQERLVKTNPDTTEFQNVLAMANNNIGILLTDSDPDEALIAFKRAREIHESLVRANPDNWDFSEELAKEHSYIGDLLAGIGKMEEALAAKELGRNIKAQLAKDNPSVVELQRQLALSQNSIGLLLGDMERTSQAMSEFEKAVEIQRSLLEKDPTSTEIRNELGGTLSNMAVLDVYAERFSKAIDRLNEAVECQKTALAINPNHRVYRQFLANHYANLLYIANAIGDSDLATQTKQSREELALSDPQAAPLEKRLQELLEGQLAASAQELLAVAHRAYDTGRYTVAARFWMEALEMDGSLADDRETQVAYNAACVASLAASGEGSGKSPDETERSQLRNMAFNCLSGEIDRWKQFLKTASPQERQFVVETLTHWQSDFDLAGLRETSSTDLFSQIERDKWKSLWQRVDEQIKELKNE